MIKGPGKTPRLYGRGNPVPRTMEDRDRKEDEMLRGAAPAPLGAHVRASLDIFLGLTPHGIRPILAELVKMI